MKDRAPWLERAFEIEAPESSYPIQHLEGEIPEWLRGVYYLNGPARFRRGGLRYRHWLDGDGMVSRLRFAPGSVRFTNRFVRSRKLVEEEAAQRPIYRAFGTRFDGDRLKRGVGLESPVNVSVYPAFGTLLAFGEQGLPWELDPESLETRGEYTFDGRLKAISPFSAHPTIDPGSGELWNFGISFSARRPCINFYRFDAGGGMLFRRRLELAAPCSVHDFGLSGRHAVFYLGPHLLAVDVLMEKGGSVMDALSWRPELGSRLLIADRENGERVAEVEIGARYCLHQINCFEKDGRLVVDVVELERPIYDQYTLPDLFRAPREAEAVRYVVDPERGEVVTRRALDFSLMADFPAVDPRRSGRPYRHFWALAMSHSARQGRKFFDQLVHFDWETGRVDAYRAPAACYLGGEPVLLGHPEREEDGRVICQSFDARERTSRFLLFDARSVAAGPVASLGLEAPMPLAFHASFQPDRDRPRERGNHQVD